MIGRYKQFEPEIHETCYIAPNCSIVGDVTIGRNSSVWFNTVIRGDVAGIRIGENTNIQDNCTIHCITDAETKLGNNISIGHGAILHSCSIDDGSLIGMGAIVLDGVKVGKNCLVGAGAVVTPNTVIPDGSLVLGSPAKIKRELTQEEIQHIYKNAGTYVALGSDYKAVEP